MLNSVYSLSVLLLHVTLAIAQAEFITRFQFSILAPDSSQVRVSRLWDGDSEVSRGGEWVMDTAIPSTMTGYQQLAAIPIYRTSPDPWRLSLQSLPDTGTYSLVSVCHILVAYVTVIDTRQCNFTLNHDPKVPRLDWILGSGVDFDGTINAFESPEAFTIVCEAHRRTEPSVEDPWQPIF